MFNNKYYFIDVQRQLEHSEVTQHFHKYHQLRLQAAVGKSSCFSNLKSSKNVVLSLIFCAYLPQV